jgi:hypothetical protein
LPSNNRSSRAPSKAEEFVESSLNDIRRRRQHPYVVDQDHFVATQTQDGSIVVDIDKGSNLKISTDCGRETSD